MTKIIKACLGIDVGTSGIRVLLLDISGNTIKKRNFSYQTLKNTDNQIWDEDNRIELQNLNETLNRIFLELNNTIENVQVLSLSVSSIGPSLVLLSEDGTPLNPAYTYAYRGAHDFIKNLGDNFQEKTGSMFSGALPFVQLLQLSEEGKLENCSKITTINDYISWNLSALPFADLFCT